MRRVVMLAAGAVMGFWLFSGGGVAGVPADTPVLVLPADDIVLRLPISPSIKRISDDLEAELTRIGSATDDPRIADALLRMAADPTMRRRIATAPVEMFDNGEAAATATPVYDVDLGTDEVIVVVTTVELVPAYGSTAASREHEDGHALINKTIARRCAPAALEVSVATGYQGNDLISSMISYLADSNDPVHARYHELVEHAGYGTHIRQAERALDETPGCSVR